LTPNEVVYPNARFASDTSHPLQQQLRHFSTETSRFELATFAVCFDDRKKLLIDNIQYDPEVWLQEERHTLSLWVEKELWLIFAATLMLEDAVCRVNFVFNGMQLKE